MEALYILIWIALSFLVGYIGQDRKIGFGLALMISLVLSPAVGLVVVLLSEKNSANKNIHEFTKHLELAKKAEYKEQVPEAINHYMDTLYHLENDYQNRAMSKSDNERRLKLIESLKQKVDILKARV
ncbi:MAG: hypothetical protein M9933_18675 [Chitinophagaceae bacterium]|nr:hypothetical protein [Chitinophagaceae bacterium]